MFIIRSLVSVRTEDQLNTKSIANLGSKQPKISRNITKIKDVGNTSKIK